MKFQINDFSKLSDLKDALAERNVSAKTMTSIERALKSGFIFKTPEDFKTFNLPAADVRILSDLVVFNPPGTNPGATGTVQTFQFFFSASGDENLFHSYQFIINYIQPDGLRVAESFPIEDNRMVIADLDLSEISATSPIIYQVKTATGEITEIHLDTEGSNFQQEIEIQKSALANATIIVKVLDLNLPQNPSLAQSYQIKGRLIIMDEDKLDGYKIVIMAAVENNAANNPDFIPVAFSQTESNGYFITSFIEFSDPEDIFRVLASKALISKDEEEYEFPIKLVKSTFDPEGGDVIERTMLPKRLIIVINTDSEGKDKDCDCNSCNELNFLEKKVFEEFDYYSVVRTTEPSIIADVIEEEEDIDLTDIFGDGGKVPISVFRDYLSKANYSGLLAQENNNPTILKSANADFSSANTGINFSMVLNKELLNNLVIKHKIGTVVKGKNKRQFKGRSYLNPQNQIDWDEEPTIYQAASIAHGHLLHFKQEWMPDGYSIGDLLYSLPLAPGQKKQIAVLDWARKESAANSQQLDYQEVLNNSLIRDRDISEVVSATLAENIRANSSSSTSSLAGGFGGAIIGAFTGGLASGVLGISGGTSKAGTSANQNSSRQSTANSLQSLRDKTAQASSFVRSQRATVIQTVTQGETVEATSESVANYNHCHAITIQYFEVLRHFTIRNRLAGVQECLFIPLQISPFTLEKTLRWRTSLSSAITNPRLLKGFEAIERIQNERENNSNYYDSIGYPKKYYAEEAIDFYTGELTMEFTFFSTQDGRPDSDMISFFKLFMLDLSGITRLLRKEELASMVGPRTIEFLLNAIQIETDKGSNLNLDLTLLNSFRPNARLLVSLRQTAATSRSIRRELIEGINIKFNPSGLSIQDKELFDKLHNKFLKVTLRSGSLRYRTRNLSGHLFNGRIDNDLFADGDHVFLPVFLNGEELRNPRGEDIEAANLLLNHLNENLEGFHTWIWRNMTQERRYMLLDGIIAPGKAKGRSVASVVENRIIGIAGNSLIMPVAAGFQLDPTIDESFDMYAQYYNEEEEPSRVSLPTKGVYAEAVMGKCNSCEVIDDTRFWRWEESPIPDSPTTPILPINTDTRRSDVQTIQPMEFPNSVLNIQNPPAAPDPTGLAAMLSLIGKGDSFRDLTGLNQTQLNALQGLQKAFDTAQSFGKEASTILQSQTAMKLLEDAKRKGIIDNEQAKQKGGEIIDKAKADPQANKLQESLKMLDELQKQGKITPETSTNTISSLLKNLLDSGNPKSAMLNEELTKLMDKAKDTGKDVKIERPDGEKLEITKASENAKSLPIENIVNGFFSPLTQKKNSAWAAAVAMLLSFKQKQAVSVAGALGNIDASWRTKFENDQSLTAEEFAELAADAELTVLNTMPEFTALNSLLSEKGPVAALTDYSLEGTGPENKVEHFVLIIGVQGDLNKTDEMKVLIFDPVDGVFRTEVLKEFSKKVGSSSNKFGFKLLHIK